MKPYSLDLRQRIVASLNKGLSVQQAAEQFEVSRDSVRRYQRLAEQDALSPKPTPGKAPRLKPEQECAFMAMIQEHPDFTLEQFQHQWLQPSGVWLPKSTLHDHLKRLGGRYKKRAASHPSDAR